MGLAYVEKFQSKKLSNLNNRINNIQLQHTHFKGIPWDGRGDLDTTFGPRDLFGWIYAILHSPSYRSRYGIYLKTDFPHIPLPGCSTLFCKLVHFGEKLIQLHLLKVENISVLENPEVIFCGKGEAKIVKGYPKYENGKVFINPTRWFERIPEDTWRFYVGGYQVCEKWLKVRGAKGGKRPSEGRILSEEDTLHYCRTVTALTESRRIMTEIDETIEAHGGWPDAFDKMVSY